MRNLRQVAERRLPVGWDHYPVRAARDNGLNLRFGRLSAAASPRQAEHLLGASFQLHYRHFSMPEIIVDLLISTFTRLILVISRQVCETSDAAYCHQNSSGHHRGSR